MTARSLTGKFRAARLPPGKRFADHAHLDDAGRPICMYCNELLRLAKESRFWSYTTDVIQPCGWAGNDMFCTQACAASWGVFRASTTTEV